MNNIGNDTKVTLTVKQLKQLVKEACPGPDSFMKDDVNAYIPWLRKSLEQLARRDSRYNELIDSLNDRPALWRNFAQKALRADVYTVEDLRRWIEYRRG